MTAIRDDPPPPPAADEDRLDALLGAYYEAVAAGADPGRDAWIAAHPEHAAALAGFFAAEDRLHRLTAPLRAAIDGIEPPTGPDDGGPVAVADAGPVPATFDGYALLGVLGRGGMGVVYRARQLVPSRIVALKTLSPGRDADAAELARFRNEAEAVAHLDHPNIVPVYEVGSHQGVGYFSMKLIDGGDLAARRAEFADPRRAAGLIAAVARAVHHAHQRGVLHRDLKPSNILIDADGRPHVGDFGLARRVESDSGLTRSGAILGTPSYMAPEQAAGRRGAVTVATDVYGLGAILYTLLAGRPPFAGDSPLEVLERVRSRPPEPPVAPDGRPIDRDLRTVCLCCLEKNPARRYPSAAALADDLDRWLSGLPIAARPAGPLEKTLRWCRRNPAMATLIVAAAGLLATILIGSVVAAVLIARERDRAEARTALARHLADRMFTRFVDDWLADQPGSEPLVRELLAEALAAYEAFARDDADEPTARAAVALASRRVGEIQFKLNAYPAAEAAFRRSVRVFDDLSRADPAYRAELVASEQALGRLLIRSGAVDEGRAAFARALAVARRDAADAPADPSAQLRLADALRHVGGEAALGEALEILGDPRIAASDPSAHREILAGVHGPYGSLLYDLGRPAEALEHHREALRLHEAAFREGHARYARQRARMNATTDLARDLQALGTLDEAIAAYRLAVERAEALTAQFPAIPDNHVNLAICLGNLGDALREAGQVVAAGDHLARAVALLEAQVRAHPRNYEETLAAKLVELGRLRAAEDRTGEARVLYGRALDLYDRFDGFSANTLESRRRRAEVRAALAALPAEAPDAAGSEPAADSVPKNSESRGRSADGAHLQP